MRAGAMIRRPRYEEPVTRPHQWLDVADLESEQHEFECYACKRKRLVPFGSDQLDDEHNISAETGGNCPKWQAE